MGYTSYKPKLKQEQVEAIKEYEANGLYLIDKYRKDIINVSNKPVSWFFNHKFKNYTHDHADGRYIFVPSEHETKVLAVAHLDTVVCPKEKGFSWNAVLDQYGLSSIKMTTVDDRLGLAMILFVFPAMGIHMDWLFTEGEEQSKSTARGWKHPDGKEYNWMAEFDRNGSFISGGNDAVTYMYKGDEWHAALGEAGMKSVAHGTYTDICYLQQLGCKALNMAIGYHDNHSLGAWFRVGEWMRSIDLFKAFYEANKDTKYPHTPVASTAVTAWTGHDRYWSTFIGYTTSKYQAGDVVMTSSNGRWDKTPQIGEIFDNPRGDFWTLVDHRGYVIDIVSSTSHIIKHMACPNCGQTISHHYGDAPRWGLYKNLHAFCGECWQICQEYPDHVIDLLVSRQAVDVDGHVGTIETIDSDGALLNIGGELIIIEAADMDRAVKYVSQLGKDKLVVVNDIFLDLSSVRYTYLILDSKDDKVYIRQADLPDGPTWIVPANIMTPVSINEAEA